MARKVIPLTNTQVKQAKSKEKEYSLNDGDGLSLRIRPSGSKSWFFTYLVPITKKRFKISFGSYPEVTLAQARKKRDEARALVVDGIDPKVHKLTAETEELEAIENTFAKQSERWLELKKKNTLESTYLKRKQMLAKYLSNKLDPLPLTDIKPMLVKSLLDPIAREGKIETVKRLCIILNEIMRLGVASGAIEFNPISDITKLYPNKKVVHNPALTPEELPELVNAIKGSNTKTVTRCLIMWQLHTMVRPGEAARARWSEVDLENRVWVIPSDTMKMKKEHLVPLTDQMIEILEEIKPISGHREFIFPADRKPKDHSNPQTANMALKRMGFEGRTTAHGLRSLASTTLNVEGFNRDLIETALAHEEENKIRKAYNRADYLEPRRPMMSWWSERIERSEHGEMMEVGFRGLRIVNTR
ncbi:MULTISPECIES: tyrosine-type recombinase/integrase [Vibrio]|uniref:tyrosine-type recombinase/integrase n=1 Tax=Vibrio TaxID=662 RepID=UPI00200B7F71|nr:tyrosine-type recombinase/integrase [Vibrio crassostreae]UPR28978.1 tyrosine-type recombinase/integrase [Vibrio crassostreae]